MNNSPDLSSVLSSLSANPSAMGALTELLKNLSPQSQTESKRCSEPPQYTPCPPPPPEPKEQCGTGLSPELIGALLSALGSSSRESKKEERRECCDSCQGTLNKLLGSKTDSENRLCLLNALRPYLGEERRSTLDLLLKLIKLAEVGKLSGLLSSV